MADSFLRATIMSGFFIGRSQAMTMRRRQAMVFAAATLIVLGHLCAEARYVVSWQGQCALRARAGTISDRVRIEFSTLASLQERPALSCSPVRRRLPRVAARARTRFCVRRCTSSMSRHRASARACEGARANLRWRCMSVPRDALSPPFRSLLDLEQELAR